jgi:hypothetical protein
MPKPAGNGWHIDTGLNAPRGEKMPEIVMGDRHHPDGRASGSERALAFTNPEDGGIGGFQAPPAPDFGEESGQGRRNWNHALA